MRVMKFGGSSVGSAEAMLKVRDIVKDCGEDVVVVVSAMRGITDMLIETAALAVSGNPAYESNLAAMYTRHMDAIEGAVPPEKRRHTQEKVTSLFDELSNIYKGVFLIRDLSQKTSDAVMSYGERFSSVITAAVIEGAGYVDARDIIKTHPYYKRHVVDFKISDALISKAFDKAAKVTVVPGFVSADAESGDTSTLGRGGSDYTAAILAAALDASVLEIWTDVDGFMTADPKMVGSAYVIERLSYVEAIELCNFGAKVIYPPAIYPVYHKDIPILIKNTFNPSAAGTYISKEKAAVNGKAIKGISSVADSCLITVQGFGQVGVAGVNYRIFKCLAKAGISVFFLSQAASENNITIGVTTEDSSAAVDLLREEFRKEMSLGEINDIERECGLATVAIVGDNMKHTTGIAGKLFGTLGRNGVNVIAIAQGASETNISFVVTMESLRKAMNVIHDSFFLSEYQVLNVFIAGIGGVGRSLIEQLRIQQPKLLKNNSLQIRVVGISNSRKCIFNRKGVDLTDYRQLLEMEGAPSSPQYFKEEIVKMNIFNSVFVDCTADQNVADIYGELLEHNVSVVTANKIAASSKYENYERLKQTARRRGIKFLFETNVGAGLPIINTISDLRNSGDKILKIEAVVSGTLNFIFNNLSPEIPFSRTVRMAQEAGYAEPDPRLDLNGSDVVRKIVILARESGYRIEREDVETHLFIPEKLFKGGIEEFWRQLPDVDAEFEQRRKRLEAEGLRLRFIARFEDGKAEVALREVDSASPFYNLEGSNNVISITTERYKQYPMQIKGYGAGAEVTAAGVFADVISIANIR